MWEILSYQGTIDEVMLTRLFAELQADRGEAQGSDPGRCDPEKKRAALIAKDALRYARHLQRRIDQKALQWKHLHPCDRQLLRELADGSLLATANKRVLEQGRGRLRGDDPDDYLDIGTNQEISMVSEMLDGEQPLPSLERFRR